MLGPAVEGSCLRSCAVFLGGSVVSEDGSVLHDHVEQLQAVHICQPLQVVVCVALIQSGHQLCQPLLPTLEEPALFGSVNVGSPVICLAGHLWLSVCLLTQCMVFKMMPRAEGHCCEPEAALQSTWQRSKGATVLEASELWRLNRVNNGHEHAPLE